MTDDAPRWDVEVSMDAAKTLQRLDATTRSRILTALLRLQNGPQAGDVKPLSGRPEWRLRVGKWRVLLDVNLVYRKIVVLDVGSRGDIYKG